MHYTTSCNTQASAPEDGQNNCPKHVLLIGIINKQLVLHLVGCLHYLYQYTTLKTPRSFVIKMRNISVEICKAIQNTHFPFNNTSPPFFLFCENRAIREMTWKIEKYGKARQAT